MSRDVPKKLLQAQCRQLLETQYELLEHLIEEIVKETDAERIEGETSFDYAKKTIYKQGIKGGLKTLLQKINKYSDGK